MKVDVIKLTLQEKLQDLRKERGLRLTDVENLTGISSATLSRFETNPESHISYQDLLTLAKLYEVSMDYFTGLTHHRRHRHTPIDRLNLTDEAVEVLKHNPNPRLRIKGHWGHIPNKQNAHAEPKRSLSCPACHNYSHASKPASNPKSTHPTI